SMMITPPPISTPLPYTTLFRSQLQAVIAACHASAGQAADTDWRVIARVYGQLARIAPSPVVELNRAVAVGMADGPAAGLALLDSDRKSTRLNSSHVAISYAVFW